MSTFNYWLQLRSYRQARRIHLRPRPGGTPPKRIIDYTFQEKESLGSHYISVQKGNGVILKGKRCPVVTPKN
ncbi:MAG: hypothetical protein ACI8VT_001969 [Saprospiraceae bacterium]|jgi:hypothetical protein